MTTQTLPPDVDEAREEPRFSTEWFEVGLFRRESHDVHSLVAVEPTLDPLGAKVMAYVDPDRLYATAVRRAWLDPSTGKSHESDWTTLSRWRKPSEA